MERNNDLISRSALLKELEWLKANVNESSKEEVEEYIQRVKNAPAVTEKPQWISVKERLPKEDGYYLVSEKGGYVGKRYFNKACPHRFIGTFTLDTVVTHWMPPPEPPKEVTK